MKTKNFEKCDYIRKAALATFLRYGFKKTSMDDIAKAAGITRQGLYFHFQSKDELFAAAVRSALESTLQAVTAALESTGSLPPEDLLFRALDAWFGSYAGLFGCETSEWDFHCNRLLKVDLSAANLQFRQELNTAIAKVTHSPAESLKTKTIADVLCTCGQAWKRTAASHEEFAEKMHCTIRLCCQNNVQQP